jgi:hypothetical protein
VDTAVLAHRVIQELLDIAVNQVTQVDQDILELVHPDTVDRVGIQV